MGRDALNPLTLTPGYFHCGKGKPPANPKEMQMTCARSAFIISYCFNYVITRDSDLMQEIIVSGLKYFSS